MQAGKTLSATGKQLACTSPQMIRGALSFYIALPHKSMALIPNEKTVTLKHN